MRIRLIYPLAVLVMLGWGCQSAVGCPPCQSQAGSQKEKSVQVTDNQNRHMDPRQVNVLRARYAPLSTMSSTLLLTVQNEKSSEQAVIVIDHEYWYKQIFAKTKNVDTVKCSYEEVMMDHLLNGKPFVVDSETYAKLKKHEAPEPAADLRALSMEEISGRFLRPIPRSRNYWTVKQGVKMDRAFIRLLLEKGCVLNSSCLDGSPIITW